MKKMFSIPLVGLTIAMIIKEMYYLGFYFLPGGIYKLFAIIGFVLIFYFLFRAKLQGRKHMLFFFFMLWTVFIILRGSLIGNYPVGVVNPSIGDILSECVRDSMTSLAFFVPLVFAIKPDLRSLFYYKKIAIVLSVVFVVAIFFMRSNIFTIGSLTSGMSAIEGPNGDYLSLRTLMSTLAPGFGLVVLMFLNFNYVNSRLALLFPVALIVFLFGQIIGGGRGGTFMTLVEIVLAIYLTLKYPISGNHLGMFNSKIFKKTFTFVFAIGFIVGIVYVYNETTIMNSLLEKTFGGREYTGQLAETGREGIEVSMVKDFNNHPLDWLIGRGGNGSYVDHSTLSINGRRSAMEWGYLYLILKGGIIYLIMTIIFFVRATYLGLFKSKNLLSKAMGITCGFFLIGFASTGCEPEFRLGYLLPWMCAGWLEDPKIRYLSDEIINNFFNIRNYSPK